MYVNAYIYLKKYKKNDLNILEKYKYNKRII